jgi:UV radiation resistance-associated gene protein
MADGYYASISDLPNIESVRNSVQALPPTPRSATLPLRETSSFDALLKLKDLTECIEDAEKTRSLVTRQIESIIQESKAQTSIVHEASQKKASADAVKDALEKTRRQVQKLRDEKAMRLKNLQDRRAAMEAHMAAQKSAEQKLIEQETQLQRKSNQQSLLKTSIIGQTRRVVQELLDIYPLEPIDGHPLCFTIRGHFLPSAKVFEQENLTGTLPPSSHESTAAALGYAAQIVALLEAYLMIPLPYTPVSFGSTSTIFDPLSSARELGLSTSSGIGPSFLTRTQAAQRPSDDTLELRIAPAPSTHPYRLFPLYQQGTQSKRFRWAIYLLNKDIEELMQQSGCKVMDPRNTLANLKYLLTVLASGKGEMPSRKAGIIKALDKQV